MTGERVGEIVGKLTADHRRLLGRTTFVRFEGPWMEAFDLRDMGLAECEPGLSLVGTHIRPTELGLAVRASLKDQSS